MNERAFEELWALLVEALRRLGSDAWIRDEIRPRRYAFRVKLSLPRQLELFA